MKRVRLGIMLIILSWLPFAQLILYFAHNNNLLMSNKASNSFRLIVWGIQILIGIIGVWLVGKPAYEQARSNGWRKLPGYLWMTLINGDQSSNAD